jgi:hypothetical protein
MDSLGMWSPEFSNEEEPEIQVSKAPLDLESIKLRWMRSMIESRIPCHGRAKLIGNILVANSDSYLFRSAQLAVRAIGRCKCSVCEKHIGEYVFYEVHTTEQFDREATWGKRTPLDPEYVKRLLGVR